MTQLIGREYETKELLSVYNSKKSEFVAIYGRRRVGKTFLVDEVLKNHITFRHAGLSPVDRENNSNNMKKQLSHFFFSLKHHGMKSDKKPTSWEEAFFMLEKLLESKGGRKRQVVFLDELPWLDTPRAGFSTAFEGFWNTWGCHRNNLMVVVCGSASSWMLDKLVNNHGGLYGRVTYEIHLHPFTLAECEAYCRKSGLVLSRYDIVQSYMILGGIPYYLGYLQQGKSLAQNIDQLFFAPGAKLHEEYDRLFASVFSQPEQMKRIVELLASRRMGFTRKEILKKTELPDCGPSSKLLKALVSSDFIQTYVPFGKSAREPYYKLTDPFCIFYLKFVRGRKVMDAHFWMHNTATPRISAWRGFAFEEVCFSHVDQIKTALGIQGIQSSQSAWAAKGDEEDDGAQLDMLIVRNDNIVNLCEMKFYGDTFSVDKAYYKKMVVRQNLLATHLPKRAAIHNTLVTTEGLKYNEYSGIFQNAVTLDALFGK